MATSNIRVYRDLMGENEKWAAKTREFLAARHLTMLNLIGSPGSGKTTLLASLVREAGAGGDFSVLEGDVETTHDAERIAALGIPVSQLLTNGACHLEAKLVHYALKDLAVKDRGTVVVENVGNLVCPAEFNVGEDEKGVVLSITEGDDKPMKYPLIFKESAVTVLNKVDILPYTNFDMAAAREDITTLHPDAYIIETSCTTGQGLAQWFDWLRARVRAKKG